MKNILPILAFSMCLYFSCNPDDPAFDPAVYDCIVQLETNHPKAEIYQDYIDKKVLEGLPGITMLIENEQGIWVGSAGKAELQFNTDMKPCNMQRLGSSTKVFTATLIFQLYEDGLLDIDATISEYLPLELIEGISNYEVITIKQLLNHQSGIADYLDISYAINYYDDLTRVWNDKEELSFVYGEDAVFTPGEFVDYSNTNYLLLGMIVKELTNKSGGELYRENIFSPLGMTNSFFSEKGDRPESLVRGYHDENGKGNMIDVTNRSFASHSLAGGAMSNVEDLYKFVKATWDSEQLISNATKFKIVDVENHPPFLKPDQFTYGSDWKVRAIDAIGLSWFQYDTEQGVCLGHDGGMDGRRSVMRYFPSSKTTIIYLINGSGESIRPVLRELRRNGLVELAFDL